MKGSTGHHRIIKYNLGGLEVLTRFEVDAYLSDNMPARIDRSAASRTAPTFDLDALTSSLQKVHLDERSQVAKSTAAEKSSTLRVIHGGYKVPHTSLIELKTRALRRPLSISDVIYQLWFAQVRHLITGYHSRGKFIRTDQSDFHTTGEFRKFEQSKGSSLRKFVTVIQGIRTAMVDSKLKTAVLLFEGGTLKLYERSGMWAALPADLLSKWG
jgi:hypothetical protein